VNDRIVAGSKERYISLSPQTTLRFLPQSYPFILLDRVKACYPGEGVGLSVKHITMTDPVLSGHFPGFPIYPGVLIIEAMVQNAGNANNMCWQKVGSSIFNRFSPAARSIWKHVCKWRATACMCSKSALRWTAWMWRVVN